MTHFFKAVWLGLNPNLQRFDQRLCKLLGRQVEIKYWGYHQTADESSCIDTALSLLHDYFQEQSEPVHLIGHGLSGSLGLLYARLYPSKVKSLTLLSVGANPAISWHSHYYALRNTLPCSRPMILQQMAKTLFGYKNSAKLRGIASLLEQVLDTEFSPHSLAKHDLFAKGGASVPLLVCRGAYDSMIDPNEHSRWQPYLQKGDRLWTCPEGRYFFHHSHARKVSPIILDFWQQATSPQVKTPLIEVLL